MKQVDASNTVRKVLVLNPSNSSDYDILQFLKGKKFSTYVRKLIENDMSQKRESLPTSYTEMYNMVLAMKDEIDALKRNQVNNTPLAETIKRPEEETVSKPEESVSEEDLKQLEAFKNVMG